MVGAGGLRAPATRGSLSNMVARDGTRVGRPVVALLEGPSRVLRGMGAKRDDRSWTGLHPNASSLTGAWAVEGPGALRWLGDSPLSVRCHRAGLGRQFVLLHCGVSSVDRPASHVTWLVLCLA